MKESYGNYDTNAPRKVFMGNPHIAGGMYHGAGQKHHNHMMGDQEKQVLSQTLKGIPNPCLKTCIIDWWKCINSPPDGSPQVPATSDALTNYQLLMKQIEQLLLYFGTKILLKN